MFVQEEAYLDLSSELNFLLDYESGNDFFPLMFFYRNEMNVASERFLKKLKIPYDGQPFRPDELIPDDCADWDVTPRFFFLSTSN